VPLLSFGGEEVLRAGDREGPGCGRLQLSFSGLLVAPLAACAPPGLAGSAACLGACAVAHAAELAARLGAERCGAVRRPGAEEGEGLLDRQPAGGKAFLGAWVGEDTRPATVAMQFILLLCLLAFNTVTSFEAAREGVKDTARQCVFDGSVTGSAAVQALGTLTFLVAAVPLTLNVYGQLRWPATLRRPASPASDLMEEMRELGESPVLIFRFCTRGNNPSLVRLNVRLAHEALIDSGLSEGCWRLEVVTDAAMGLGSALPGVPVQETVVPAEYRCPRGGKFKARAMHWAVLHSKLRPRPSDWIVHLDEETRFDGHAVCAILRHCLDENVRVKEHGKRGEVVFPDCGQGVILYNTNGVPLEAHLTAMADVARVADDLGKFRLCSESLQFPAIGMHGSFAIINQAVETAIGFDHGEAASITEDSYFACVANAELRVGIRWIDAFMFEQSPFGPLDLIHQRARWFHGMSYCTFFFDNNLPIRTNFIITCFMMCWSCQFLIMSVRVVYQLGCGDQGVLGLLVRDFVAEVFCVNYLLGFLICFSPYREGVGRWLCLLFMNVSMLLPISLIELTGVLRGMYLVATNANEFYIVQKESARQSGPSDELEDDLESTTASDHSLQSVNDIKIIQ